MSPADSPLSVVVQRVIVMGVSGSGKSTLGRALGAALHAPFLDGDDYHTPQARARMHAGHGLTDADRAPWLARLRAELDAQGRVVLACSALKRTYRDALRAPGTRFLENGRRGVLAALGRSRELLGGETQKHVQSASAY